MTMNEQTIFPDIDTSYWKIKDKQWMAERKEQWSKIDWMLMDAKSSKGRTIVKHFFLTGKMPNWDALENWEDTNRHLDIFLFLWLHPSWDEKVLRSLRDAYMNSDLIQYYDLDSGFSNFLSWGCTRTASGYAKNTNDENKYLLKTDGHNELLFKILMDDLKHKTFAMNRIYNRSKIIFELPQDKFRSINEMGEWLCIKKMTDFHNDMLYQYDLPLEWWYQSCSIDEDYFLKKVQEKAHRAFFEKALWRIHHFDEVKEGLGPRTTFVLKIRKILDERPFIKEFEQMWQRVKADEISISKPWKV